MRSYRHGSGWFATIGRVSARIPRFEALMGNTVCKNLEESSRSRYDCEWFARRVALYNPKQGVLSPRAPHQRL